jgi:fused signal recognition particle receptor
MGLFAATAGALRRSLRRTRVALQGLGGFLRGRTLDNDTIAEIEARLLQADVGVDATSAVIARLRHRVNTTPGANAHTALRDCLLAALGERVALASPASTPMVLLVAGVNGVGKTTSVAKIAHALQLDGRSVLLAAADTFRAGATAQLQIWGERLGIDVITGRPGADPASVTWDALDAAISKDIDVLVVDTSGRMHNDPSLMRELVKIRDVIAKRIEGAPHEVLLVLDATQGQNALQQATAFQKAVDVTGLFLAKLDGSARGGVVLAIADALALPVKLVGLGERVEDVEPFEPADFVDGLLVDEA